MDALQAIHLSCRRGAGTAESVAQPECVADEMTGADLIATAVWPDNLVDTALLIAAVPRQCQRPVNLLAFENLADAAPYLRERVGSHLPKGFPLTRHGFSSVLVSLAVTQRPGDPAGDEPLTIVGDPQTEFVVDGQSLLRPLPKVEGIFVADSYAAWIQRKLYIYSADPATAAYLGYLKFLAWLPPPTYNRNRICPAGYKFRKRNVGGT